MTESVGSTVTRTFAAPPEAVFDAWITGESFAAWWGGNEVNVPLDSLSMDVREGGAWSATMVVGADQPELLARGEFHMRGEYLEIDRPHRLVMTMTNEPTGEEREVLTVILTAVDGGTEMLFTQTGGHLTEDEYAGTTVGWQVAFEALNTNLAAAAATMSGER